MRPICSLFINGCSCGDQTTNGYKAEGMEYWPYIRLDIHYYGMPTNYLEGLYEMDQCPIAHHTLDATLLFEVCS